MHGGLLEQVLLGPRERVEPGGDHALHRFRQVAGRSAFGEHADVLLGEERVAARPLEQRLPVVRELQRLVEQARDQLRRLLLVQRLQGDGGRVRLPAAPGTASLQQLGPRRPDDDQRRGAKQVDEVVQELEQAVVGPVQVLEDEHCRPALGDGVEEPAPGGRRGLRRALPAVAREPDERAQLALDPARLRFLRDEPRDRLLELSFRLVGRVGLEDPGLRLHDLAERPERDALAVGNATPLAPADQLALVL